MTALPLNIADKALRNRRMFHHYYGLGESDPVDKSVGTILASHMDTASEVRPEKAGGGIPKPGTVLDFFP